MVTVESEKVMSPPYTSKVKRYLYKGTKGADVKYIQESLNIINAVQPFRPFEDDLKNNGDFDQKTHFFVVSFQIYNGITPNGFIDSVTMNEIERRLGLINRKYKYDPFDKY